MTYYPTQLEAAANVLERIRARFEELERMTVRRDRFVFGGCAKISSQETGELKTHALRAERLGAQELADAIRAFLYTSGT